MSDFDFSNKILIDSTEFQRKVLDYISSCEIDKMIDATVFKDNQECKQAIIHGMRFVDPSDYRKGVVKYSNIYKQRDNKRL